ncbi:retrotransposon protein [Striga asiatica]|uniref:Retrotransposon protein n=1 Tax=Striga asiatica TaxID=4170 RepID=A0A5A7R646_STRAF|nr:retrotransposon protein [Striga asiatica]
MVVTLVPWASAALSRWDTLLSPDALWWAALSLGCTAFYMGHLRDAHSLLQVARGRFNVVGGRLLEVGIEGMRTVPYASTVESLMYAMLCTRPNISYAISMVAKYQSNPSMEHWSTSDWDKNKSASGYVFTLGVSTMEAEYVTTSEAAKDTVWLRDFLDITVYCDNSGAVIKIASEDNLADPFTKSLP